MAVVSIINIMQPTRMGKTLLLLLLIWNLRVTLSSYAKYCLDSTPILVVFFLSSVLDIAKIWALNRSEVV